MTTLLRHLTVSLTAVVGTAVAGLPVQAADGTLSNGCALTTAQTSSQAYLDALSDGSKATRIPLDYGVVRFENGLLTALTAPALVLDLTLHVQYSLMSNMRNVVWQFEPQGKANVVRADYDLTVGLFGANMGTSHVKEDFTLTSRCTIKRIDATITVGPAS